jgi:hypothetical protein
MTIDDGSDNTVGDDKKGRHVDPNPDPEQSSDIEISVGAGIAIAGVWFASVGLCVFIILLFFIWIPDSLDTSSSVLSLFDLFLTICTAFAPLIIALLATKAIINRENP